MAKPPPPLPGPQAQSTQPAPDTASRAEKISELERELRLRAGVYRRHVEAGKMRQEQADRHMRIMRAILADYLATPDPSDLFGGRQS